MLHFLKWCYTRGYEDEGWTRLLNLVPKTAGFFFTLCVAFVALVIIYGIISEIGKASKAVEKDLEQFILLP